MGGSPPPMRGKDDEDMSKLKESRITPAYAGKSLPPKVRWELAVDHPRPCGEKSYHIFSGLSIIGSPPPMRGKASIPAAEAVGTGITPAYAGKSAKMLHPIGHFRGSPPPMRGKGIQLSSYGLKGWDHPRLCGEKAISFAFVAISIGSPPPMRGKVWWSSQKYSYQGITPAYAGKSRPAAALSFG